MTFPLIFLTIILLAIGCAIGGVSIWAYRHFAKNHAVKKEFQPYVSILIGCAALFGCTIVVIAAWYIKHEPDDFLTKGTLHFTLPELAGSYTTGNNPYLVSLEIENLEGPEFIYRYNTVDFHQNVDTGIVDQFLGIIDFQHDSIGKGKIVKYSDKGMKIVFQNGEFQKY